jgi:hypothetical protein
MYSAYEEPGPVSPSTTLAHGPAVGVAIEVVCREGAVAESVEQAAAASVVPMRREGRGKRMGSSVRCGVVLVEGARHYASGVFHA